MIPLQTNLVTELHTQELTKNHFSKKNVIRFCNLKLNYRSLKHLGFYSDLSVIFSCVLFHNEDMKVDQ